MFFFFFHEEDGIRDATVTGVQTCALPILHEGLTGILLGRASTMLILNGCRFVLPRHVRGPIAEVNAPHAPPAETGRTAQTRFAPPRPVSLQDPPAPGGAALLMILPGCQGVR